MQPIFLFAKLRGWNQSELARASGVSRQAVSLWKLRKLQPHPNLHSKNLQKLADALAVKADDLLRPLPVLGDPQLSEQLRASFLWDRLYPSLADFAIAIARQQPRALARLAQVYGMFAASKTAGPCIWKKFHSYKKHIHPVRRAQCEQIWNLHEHPESI